MASRFLAGLYDTLLFLAQIHTNKKTENTTTRETRSEKTRRMATGDYLDFF